MAKVYRIGFSEAEINRGVLSKSGLTSHTVSPREQIVLSAKAVLGRPYKRGASVVSDAPEAFDCSSLSAWVAVEAGYAIPRISIDQYVFMSKIKKTDLKPGDFIFSNTGKIIHTEGSYFSQVLGREVKEEPIRTETLEYKPGTQVPEGVDHVGIYVGGGKVIHATKSLGGVVEEDLATAENFQNIIGYGRLVEKDEKRVVVAVPLEQKDRLQEIRKQIQL